MLKAILFMVIFLWISYYIFFPSSLSLSFGLGSVYLWSVFVHLVMLALNLFIHSLSSSVCSVTHIRNSTQLLQLLLLAHLAPYNWSLVSAISFIWAEQLFDSSLGLHSKWLYINTVAIVNNGKQREKCERTMLHL